MKKILSSAMLALILISALTVVFNIQPVKAAEEGITYIKADGSISPPVTPIQRDGDTYTFTGDIYYSPIVVERDNIIIDGAGHELALAGRPGTWVGIDLSERTNVTVKNVLIEGFYLGVQLSSSSNNTITGNEIKYNDFALLVYNSSNNVISGNNITENDFGIVIKAFSNYSNVSGNNIIDNNCCGLWLSSSSNNNINGNTFINDGLVVAGPYQNIVENNTVNGKPLVYLEGVKDYSVGDAGQVILVNCDGIRVENLVLSRTVVGVELWQTKNSVISGNNITANNGHGIWLQSSFNNSISGNNITNNGLGVWLDSSSNYNILNGNNITANNYEGVWLDSSSNNSISGNNIANNRVGVSLEDSFDNVVSGNKITANSDYGIWLNSSSNNRFYHNNFINNKCQVFNCKNSSTNVWDDGYPSGGNYWNDYAGADADGDGIGDTPYVIDINNRDHYPLMGLWPRDDRQESLIDLSLSSLTVSVNQQISISGSLTPCIATSITLTLTKPDGSQLTEAVTTDAAGKFTYQFTPGQAGIWKVQANWRGDENYLPAKSDILSFEVSSLWWVRYWYVIIGVLAVVALGVSYTFFKLKKRKISAGAAEPVKTNEEGIS